MKRTFYRLLNWRTTGLLVACAMLATACNRSPHRMQQYELGHDTAEPESKISRVPISFNGQPTPTAWLYNPDGTKRWQLPQDGDKPSLAQFGGGAQSEQELLLAVYRLRQDCEQAATAYRYSRDTAQSLTEINAALLAGLDASKAVRAFGRTHPELLDHVRITSNCSDDSWHSWFGCYPLTAAFNGCTGDNTSRIY